MLSENTLDEITSRKAQLSADIMNRVMLIAITWGVRVISVAIKDIQFAAELQQALSAAAVAERLSDAKLISAKAEVEASKYRRQAAEQFSSKTALQYIYLEHLGQLAQSNHHSKIYFLPPQGMDLFRNENQHENAPGAIANFLSLDADEPHQVAFFKKKLAKKRVEAKVYKESIFFIVVFCSLFLASALSL